VKHSNMDTDITQDGFAFQVLFKIKWETMKQIISRANSTNLWYICYTHLSVINIYSLIKLNYISLYIQSNLSTSATLGTWKIWSLCWGSSEKDQALVWSLWLQTDRYWEVVVRTGLTVFKYF
jgi:hypothetical protein